MDLTKPKLFHIPNFLIDSDPWGFLQFLHQIKALSSGENIFQIEIMLAFEYLWELLTPSSFYGNVCPSARQTLLSFWFPLCG